MARIDTKTCSRCGREKPLDDFSPHAQTRDGRNSWCRPCAAASVRQYRSTNPKRRARDRLINRARHRALEALRRRHPDEFAALYDVELVLAARALRDDDDPTAV